MYNLGGLAFFTQHNSLEIYPGCYMYPFFVTFHCWVEFQGIDVPLLV